MVVDEQKLLPVTVLDPSIVNALSLSINNTVNEKVGTDEQTSRRLKRFRSPSNGASISESVYFRGNSLVPPGLCFRRLV